MRRVPPTVEILISSRQRKRLYVQLATVGRRKVTTAAVRYLDTDTDTAGGAEKVRSERRRGGKNVSESSLIRGFRITGLGARDNPASNSEAGRTRFGRGGHRGEDVSELKTIHLADFATPPVDFFTWPKDQNQARSQLARD